MRTDARHLGAIVTLTATGEYARPRLAFTSGPNAGRVEVGLTDGTTRLLTPTDYTPATNYPITARAIPVYPDAADGSSRPNGVCTNTDCGATANLISARPRDSRKGDPYRDVCTHCYRAGHFA